MEGFGRNGGIGRSGAIGRSGGSQNEASLFCTRSFEGGGEGGVINLDKGL